MDVFSYRTRKKLHVLMFPGLAHGHLTAYAELSNRLADRGIAISFLSTPLNITKIKPMFANRENIQPVELPLPAVDGLPPGTECTSNAPAHLWSLLLQAVLLLEKPFETLLHHLAPDYIVFDLVLYWIPKIAAKQGIPTVLFLTFGAAYCSYEISPTRAKCKEKISEEHLIHPPPGYPSSSISWRPFEARFSLKLNYDESNGMRGIDRIMTCIDGCRAIAVKSCNELEGKLIDYFQMVMGKPVLPVGPLLTRMVIESRREDSVYLEWLEKQPPGSVVYVSFGSECFLSQVQIRHLVLGLEGAGQPFVLVLHFPNHVDGLDGLFPSLPEGFELGMGKRGLVLTGWAPQREILRHPSTGAFLTHCGWNSVMEGMSVGLPLIGLPMQFDQRLNARWVVGELQVGVEVERGSDGFAKSEDICMSVRRVMVEEEGKDIRQKAWEMGNLFRTNIMEEERTDGSQRVCIDKFVDHLLCLIPDRHVTNSRR